MQFSWADDVATRAQKDFCFLVKAINEFNDEVGLSLMYNENIDPTLLADIKTFYNVASTTPTIVVGANKEIVIHDVFTETPTGDTTT